MTTDILTGLYAALPAAGTSGRIYLPSDGYHWLYDDGAEWTAWGPLFPMKEPPDTGWSWVNQGIATVQQAEGAIVVSDAGSAAYNMRVRVRSMPSTPYTFTAFMVLANRYDGDNAVGHGLVMRDSNTSRMTTFGYRNSNAGDDYLRVERWDDANNWDSSPADNDVDFVYTRMGFRIYDDGSDHYFYWSADMQNWLEFYNEGRASWLASQDEIGFFLHPEASATIATAVVSWEES